MPALPENDWKPDSRTCQVCVSGIQSVEHGGMHRHPRSAIPGLNVMEPACWREGSDLDHSSTPPRGLERLTEPSDLVEGDEACGEAGEGFVDVGASLVTDGQAVEAVEPSVCPLH